MSMLMTVHSTAQNSSNNPHSSINQSINTESAYTETWPELYR